MKTFQKISLTAVLLPAMTVLAQAHPGHLAQGGETHAHWIALGLSALAALCAGAVALFSRRNKAGSAKRRNTA